MTREEIENEVRSDLARMDLDFLHRETGISYHTKVTLITGYLLFILEKYADIRPLDEVAITLNRVKDLEEKLAAFGSIPDKYLQQRGQLAQAKKIIRSLISSVLIEWGDDIGEARAFLDKLEEE